jgi:hypothetical protein
MMTYKTVYKTAIFFLATLFVAVHPAAAYVGPGAGLSLLGALWGLLLAVAAALGFIILWPLRRMRQRARARVIEPMDDLSPNRK